MMISRLFLQRLPIFGCAGFLAVLLLINIWNFFVSTDWPKLRIRSASQLWGVSPPKPAPWTLDAFMTGETQKAFSTGFGQTQSVFPLAVQLKSQLLYSLFGVSSAPSILIGRERQLFENFYVHEFCARGASPDAAFLDAWASRLHDIQTAVEAKNKRFAFLISPSKAARYSRYIPMSFPCPALARGTTEKLAPYLAALNAHGVTYIDGASLMTASMPDYSIDLFPRGGTHWNYLGSALATRELTRALNANGRQSPIPTYDFDWQERGEATATTDYDLVRLLNLLWPDRRYPTASVAGRSNGACDKTPKLFAVGGSFLIEVIANLVEAPCKAIADYWHYIRREPGNFYRMRRLVENREAFEHSIDPRLETDEEFDKGLAGADIVLLEENEAVIGEMRQVPDLLAAASK